MEKDKKHLKQHFGLVVVVLAAALLSMGPLSCGGDTVVAPSVSIGASVTEGVAPLDVEFTATTIGGRKPFSFSWDFGDSAVSTEQNPVHVFTGGGEFTVTLTATDDKGKTSTASILMTVVNPIEVLVGADPTEGVSPQLVAFSSTVTGGHETLSYAWDFGDGGTADTPTANHLYQIAGTFDVTLTVTDDWGDTGQGLVTVAVRDDQLPVASITANPTVGVAPLEVSFQGSAVGGDAPIGYEWSFGDGETADTQNVIHTFADPGTYSVVLVVTDADGDKGTDSVDIQVASNEVPVVEIAAEPTMGIEPLNVQFTANVAGGNAPITYAWDFDGDANIDSIISNPGNTFVAGTYAVSLVITDADGDTASDTIEIQVDVDTMPEVTAEANPTAGMVPLAVQFNCTATGVNLPYAYRWDFGNGQTSSLQNPSYTYTQAGNYVATCTATDSDGDVASGTATVDVMADLVPSVEIQADPLVGTAPLAVDFTANVVGGDAPFTFAWNFGDTGTDGTQNPTHTFANAGTYTVILVVTDSDGDEATDSVDIGVTTNELPVVEISADPNGGVEPLTVRFAANVAGGNPPITYAWDFDGDSVTDSELPNPIRVFSAGTHTVSVLVQDADGDSDSDSIDILVEADSVPQVTVTPASASGLLPLGVQFDCAATGGNLPYTFQWNFGDGQGSSLQSPYYTYTQAGDFVSTCTVTDADGDQVSGTANIQVIADLEPGVSISAEPSSGLAPLSVVFTSTVTSGNPPFSFSWDFGDGGTNFVDANPTYIYSGVGTWHATLMVTDSDNDTASDTITISVGDATTPAVNASANPQTGPAPLLVNFTCSASGGNTPYTYHWNFGDGTSADTANPTHTYTGIGDYLSTCIVTDSFSQTGQGSVQIQATNPNLPPVINDLTSSNGWGGTNQACAAVGQTMLQLVVNAVDQNTPPDALTYQWSFDSVPAGSTASFNNPAVSNPTFVPDVEGQYVARVTVSDGRGGTATQTLALTAGLPGNVVALSPVPAPDGNAGESYPGVLSVRVETPCGIPFAGIVLNWSSVNGWMDWISGASNANGKVDAMVSLGCSSTEPASFTAAIKGDPDAAVFSVNVLAGSTFMATIVPQRNVPVHDAVGTPVPMSVEVRVTDRCGNQTSGDEITFNINTGPGNGACFNDLCASGGVKTLSVQNTSGGVASFQLYDQTAETVDIWLTNVIGNVTVTGGFSRAASFDFESGDGGFSSNSLNSLPYDTIQWQYGLTPANPDTAHSGNRVWGTALGGDYTAEDDWDVRYLTRNIGLPCTGGLPVYLRFWEYHDIGPNAVGYLSLGDSLTGEFPPAADGASAYNGDLNGVDGYAGQSGGWRRVSFDLSRWECGTVDLFWSLYLDNTTVTAPGWTIDDVEIEYFSSQAAGSFVAGPPWDGFVTWMGDGVAGCDTSPASFEITAWDQFGNMTPDVDMNITTDGAGVKQFTNAFPGSIVSQGAGGATINLGYWAWTDAWFNDTAAEIVNVTMLTDNPLIDPSAAVTIAPQEPETGLCQDGLDNDCDGITDCDDDDCAGDPNCILENPSFETGDFTGWILSEDSGFADWGTWGVLPDGTIVNNGDTVFDYYDGVNVTEWSPGLPITYNATDGGFVALLLVNGPERHRMFQTVTVGSGVTTLRWDMAYQNHSGGFNAGSQYLAVNVRDPATDAILATLFKTTQGIDPQQAPMQTYAVDISAFAGQTVRIDVELQGQNFFFDATFDNFKLL